MSLWNFYYIIWRFKNRAQYILFVQHFKFQEISIPMSSDVKYLDILD